MSHVNVTSARDFIRIDTFDGQWVKDATSWTALQILKINYFTSNEVGTPKIPERKLFHPYKHSNCRHIGQGKRRSRHPDTRNLPGWCLVLLWLKDQ
jgi:hypothetical protein